MTLNSLSQLDLPRSSGDHRVYSNISDGFLPYLISQLSAQHQGLCLVVANDTQQAHALEASIQYFLAQNATEQEVRKVHLFPDWEVLPYDIFSPHEDIISSRLEALLSLPQKKDGILIVSLPTLLQRVAPCAFIQQNSLSLTLGQALDVQDYRRILEDVGYRSVDTVYTHGEYALRGSIFDLFPMGSNEPIRIELFDNEIESLRTFDPETQRSRKKIEELSILPANEFPWDDASRHAFRNRWLDNFPDSAVNSPIYRDIKDGIKPHGIEFYLPLFFEHLSSLFDYLPEGTLTLFPDSLPEIVQTQLDNIALRYEDRRHDIQRPILSPEHLFLSAQELFSQLNSWPQIKVRKEAKSSSKTHHIEFSESAFPALSVDDSAEKPFQALAEQLDSFTGRSLIVAESLGRREILNEVMSKHGIKATLNEDWLEFINGDSPLGLTTGPLSQGFCLPNQDLQVITEAELYGQRIQPARRKKASTNTAELVVKNLTELRLGAPVVHIDHGVGRYRGLETISVDGRKDEFLMLEYAEQAKLYVPVSSLNLISRYSGMDESLAPLHRLGSEKWSSAKEKAMEKVRDTAAELLEVYAKRESREGFSYEYPGDAYRAFAARFPFEETVDQSQAINAVIQDMKKPQPMDRLVCGDVGFGKTEVAMRAAFIATHSGKQVAVLVPTTLLAQQHYDSFVDRFADTAVTVEVLSRFKTAKDQEKALEKIAQGKVDIIVGTHKLIQKDVKFKNLGLLIIDEEHRFGVQQKERLKALRAQVDILTMTATPIPRTLNMAMGGIRDLSIIATPPAKRLSVKTFVREREGGLIKESILREILRGGQVYYLFNDVKNIEKEVAFISDLVPEARVGYAHGQMRERELEQAMSDFYHLRFNVLVCTTIIETGIDIPNANTIIMDRADKFGLAQLHQLRGRVGRSHHQAYAYLLTPPAKSLSKDAEKRLEAIEASQELGAGFMLATHDLEIRGAGELLGEDQSGQIQSVGFSLYMELLEKAVESLKAGQTIDLEGGDHGCEVSLPLSAVIPEDYVPDVHTRLISYKRIANAKTEDELKTLQVEMIDRFGLLPEALKNLFRQTGLKLTLEKVGILKLESGRTEGKITFAATTHVDPLEIVKLVQARPDLYQLKGATTLKFQHNADNADALFQAIEQLIDRLTQSEKK